MQRGEIWWASLPAPVASEPGYRRPVLVVQSNGFNDSDISTVIVVSITTNLKLADARGNVLFPSVITGLPRDSVLNVSQVFTADKQFMTERVSKLPSEFMAVVNQNLRLVLAL